MKTIQEQLQQVINRKTKPPGALGKLEDLALQIGSVQGSVHPKLVAPHILVYAADHGIAEEGTSAYPQEVTRQMVMNFLHGGAAINVFARQQGIGLKIIDAGVKGSLPDHPGLTVAKVGEGTGNWLHEPAMTAAQLEACMNHGKTHVQHLQATGCNVIGFGEMGIGNTASASMIMHLLGNIPLAQCVGRGTGLDDQQFQRKLETLKKAAAFQESITDPTVILQRVGGFEIAQMCGAMLEAARLNGLILIDGFIASAACWVALTLEPSIRKHLVFSHLSDEHGHRVMLEAMKAEPVLQLKLRLGEGTGCALVYPLLQSAVGFLNEMASFETAGVSDNKK